jgi:hypothetical protein
MTMGGFVRKIMPKPAEPTWVEPQPVVPTALSATPEAAPPPVVTEEQDAEGEFTPRKRRGRASTILTGSQGLMDDAHIGRKLLLGQ